MTNADKIRQMTDEELAKFLNSIVSHCRQESCNDGCPMADCCACDWDWQERWLKQKATDAEQKPSAHWILADNGEAYCSECHCEGEPYMNYCPMCGKKMGGGT